ncbi:hypothetical protein [Pseudoroseicyclus aestuarii]|nr:hypothetical protein [Pseudoroseicyclus aestuarii]
MLQAFAIALLALTATSATAATVRFEYNPGPMKDFVTDETVYSSTIERQGNFFLQVDLDTLPGGLNDRQIVANGSAVQIKAGGDLLLSQSVPATNAASNAVRYRMPTSYVSFILGFDADGMVADWDIFEDWGTTELRMATWGSDEFAEGSLDGHFYLAEGPGTWTRSVVSVASVPLPASLPLLAAALALGGAAASLQRRSRGKDTGTRRP